MRRNLKSPLPVHEVTSIARNAISNYEKLFAIKYPFKKLDLVMCPEFKYGGMENVGCICYSETYLCEGQK
jgi:aminopeptidase N